MTTRPNYAIQRHELYIACDQFDFDWTIWAVSRFDQYWKDGKTLQEIARIFQRSEIELLFLYLDRVYRAKIQPDMKRIFY